MTEALAVALAALLIAAGLLAWQHWPQSMAWPMIALAFVAVYLLFGIAACFHGLGKLYGLIARRA